MKVIVPNATKYRVRRGLFGKAILQFQLQSGLWRDEPYSEAPQGFVSLNAFHTLEIQALQVQNFLEEEYSKNTELRYEIKDLEEQLKKVKREKADKKTD